MPVGCILVANDFITVPVYRSKTHFIPRVSHLFKFNSGIINAIVAVGIARGIVGVDKDLDDTKFFQEFKVAKTWRGKSMGLDVR